MPYADYGGFGEDYFEGGLSASPHPAGYTSFQRSSDYLRRYSEVLTTELTNRGIDPTGAKVLVLGCGYGYTVEYLIDDWGMDAYGVDISPYAVSRASSEIAYPERIFEGDATDGQVLRNIRSGPPFQVLFSEGMLSTLTDAEAQAATTEWRSTAQRAVVHRVYATDDATLNTDWYNGHTLAEWQALCDPNGEDYWLTNNTFVRGSR